MQGGNIDVARRPPIQAQGLGDMGDMGSGTVKPPGMGGLMFDHILSRLQKVAEESRDGRRVA